MKKMIEGTYHREIYWLSKFDEFFKVHPIKEVVYTKHLKENTLTADNRLYDIKDITLDFIRSSLIFEVEVKNNQIVKIVTLQKYKKKNDMCLALAVEGDRLRCKTCWLNRQDDIHMTLDPTKYVHGEEFSGEKDKFSVSIADLIKK